MSTGVYVIRNAVNGKVYVGSAVNIYNRWCVHKHGLTRGIHHSVKLQRAWSKHGAGAFTIETLEVCLREHLLEREQAWIDRLGATTSSGYNVCRVAGSSLGRKFSPETLEKMRLKKIGSKRSAESRARQSAATRGIPKSPEHRQKIGAAQVGKVIPPDVRKKMSEAQFRVGKRVHGPDGRFLYACGSERDVQRPDESRRPVVLERDEVPA